MKLILAYIARRRYNTIDWAAAVLIGILSQTEYFWWSLVVIMVGVALSLAVEELNRQINDG
jgi:hypothetical protein